MFPEFRLGRRTFLGACLLGLLSCGRAKGAKKLPEAEHRNWPQWRGPLGTGVAPLADPPTFWDAATGENIRWKVPLPGRGHSAPIVWDERIFLTTTLPFGEALPPRYSTAPGTHDGVPVTHHHKFVVLAVARATGEILWQREVHSALPHEGGHYTASLASASPVTDGEVVVASFGSNGLYGLDLDGKLLWRVDLGQMQTLHGHGEGSSPVLHGDTVFVNWDHEGASFVAAFDKRTGQQRWKVDRDEVTSWATPIMVEHEGRQQLVISGTNRIRAYDPATGAEIWQCGGLSTNVVASPVAGQGMVFAGSSYDTRALLAIRLAGASGDITDTDHVVWRRSRSTPYVPSPLLYDDALYFLGHYQGILTRVRATTGEENPGTLRLDGIGSIYASPIGAGGRVYVTDLEGATLVIQHGDVPRAISLNRLHEPVSASAAAVAGELFLRGHQHLYSLKTRE